MVRPAHADIKLSELQAVELQQHQAKSLDLATSYQNGIFLYKLLHHCYHTVTPDSSFATPSLSLFNVPYSTMVEHFRGEPNFTAWGPFIPDDYVIEKITKTDIIVGGTIFEIGRAHV